MYRTQDISITLKLNSLIIDVEQMKILTIHNNILVNDTKNYTKDIMNIFYSSQHEAAT